MLVLMMSSMWKTLIIITVAMIIRHRGETDPPTKVVAPLFPSAPPLSVATAAMSETQRELLRLRELLRGVGDLNKGLVEAILASHGIDNEESLGLLKGEFLDQVLETATAVSKALHLRPGLTDAIVKLGADAQKGDKFTARSGSSNCGATAFCLTGAVTDGGVTADGMTAVTPSASPHRSLLNPCPGATVAAKALMESLTAAEKAGGMDSWRIDKALKELWESQRLALESTICAGRALAIIDNFPDPPDVVIKAAKLATRDAFMWRCVGLALGMDSKEALEPVFKSSNKGDKGRSQLIMSFTKIRGYTAAAIPSEGGHAKRARGPREDRSCEAAVQTDIAPPPGLTGPFSSSRADLAAVLQVYSAPDPFPWLRSFRFE